jgi:crotonobetainyl-CoA:carnitine CoA-transferase CaiB-like acyl-CoA transferase
MMSLTGFPGDPPTKTFFPLIDRITALHATIGALAALHERSLSGRGQTIDVSLADSGFTANEIPIAAYLADGTVVEREGNGRGLTNVYRTKDGWALMHATSDAIWPRVCEALGWTEWGDDQDMASRRGRDNRLDEIGAALESWFSRRTTREAVDHLSGFSVPAAPVNSIEQAAADPHVHEREVLVETADPYAGSIHVSGKTIKFGRTPMEIGPAPTVGEHTEHVLRDIIGYSSMRFDALVAGGVVATSGPAPA